MHLRTHISPQLGLSLDYCLFWLPAMHFFLNEDLTDEVKFMFLSILGSLPTSPFQELTAVCQHAQPLSPVEHGLESS